MTVVTLASRRAAPPVPHVHASAHPTHPATSASPETDLVHLHMAAVNGLSEALRQLTGPDCSHAMWAKATARAHRGLTALKRASALAHQAGG